MKHTRTSFKIISLLLCAVMLLPLAGCGDDKMLQTQVFAMDTEMTVTAYGKNAQKGINSAVKVIESMDVMLDPELETSMVYAMNHAQGQSVVVSGQIADMINVAKLIYDRTDGYFDPTIYPVIKLWGFVDKKYYVPNYDEIESERSRMCFDQLDLQSFPSSGTYSVSMPSYGEISFASMAKGCAAENAIDAMRHAGVTSGIVTLGGNIQTLGRKPDGSNWTVAVQDPNNTSSYLGVISVGETAVVTSGSYQRFFTDISTGTTYHHLLSPTTGLPANNSLVSVTIICDNGTMADALSTAMFVIGQNKALNYWRSQGGFEMIMVTTSNEVICTSGLIEQFTLTNTNYSLKFTE